MAFDVALEYYTHLQRIHTGIAENMGMQQQHNFKIHVFQVDRTLGKFNLTIYHNLQCILLSLLIDLAIWATLLPTQYVYHIHECEHYTFRSFYYISELLWKKSL